MECLQIERILSDRIVERREKVFIFEGHVSVTNRNADYSPKFNRKISRNAISLIKIIFVKKVSS